MMGKTDMLLDAMNHQIDDFVEHARGIESQLTAIKEAAREVVEASGTARYSVEMPEYLIDATGRLAALVEE